MHDLWGLGWTGCAVFLPNDMPFMIPQAMIVECACTNLGPLIDPMLLYNLQINTNIHCQARCSAAADALFTCNRPSGWNVTLPSHLHTILQRKACMQIVT